MVEFKLERDGVGEGERERAREREKGGVDQNPVL